MAQGIESGVGGVWQTQQTTSGSRERADATTMKRFRKTGDEGLSVAKTTAAEEYVDGEAWGTPTMFVDTIGGDVGSLGFQGQIACCAFLFAQACAADVVTGSGDPYTHTIVTGRSVPADQTIYQKVGNAIGPMRQVFYDAKIGRLTYNAGQDQKVVRMTEGIQALRCAEWFTSDPTATDNGEDPLRWDQAVTRINGTALPEIRGDTIELDANLGVYRGQTGNPVCFEYGKGAVTSTVESTTTDGTLPEIRRAIYGTNAPADGAPVSSDVVYCSLETTYTVSVRRTLTLTRPRVEIRADDWAFGPRAEGGLIPVAFGGRCLKADSSTPILRVVALTG